MTETVSDLRCWRCDKKLANLLTPPFSIDCPRCGTANVRLLNRIGASAYNPVT